MAMTTSVSGQVPVKVLHRDGSISNSLIVDQALSDWPPLKAPEGCVPPNTHIWRGLHADWGFAAVFEDTEELAEHSDDSKERSDDVSEDSDQDDHYFGLKFGDIQKLQELVKSMLFTINHEEETIHSDQKGTLDEGTEPFMAVEVQNAQPGDWIQHTAHHNLELFYYVLLAMCVLMVKPYEMKDADAKEKDNMKKWLNPEFTSMFTHSDTAFHKYQTFGRVNGLSLFLENNVSEYFTFMIPYFKRLCKVLFGSTLFLSKKFVEADSSFLILQHNKMLVNHNTPHLCPASCGRSFSSTRALNTHLGSARSCAWYRKGKLREILTQQDGDLERQGLLVEENLDNPYGPLHPFQEESIGDVVEVIRLTLYPHMSHSTH
ncbi:hypothetical protein SERLA73DRAFT_150236 [Serpula lacrymans var. lacrymans S7.3]|uniref:Fungal-type protein kinase domain-containing protein n=1 Tax=Serpula lacrymans var. lacrymans (strain S7.3) TaxID=936435 RepID=F8PLN3_SERL3|nr:hypothetical protein SERLA73DRAFT_150236 [Serpula lacrymans var. lacrymans S7.3]